MTHERVTSCVVGLALLLMPWNGAAGQVTQRASVDAAGLDADTDSFAPALAANGRHCVFYSGSTNLVAGDGNFTEDVFVKDLCTGAIERVSVDSSGVEADQASFSGVISADGLVVAFASIATNLVPNDTNGRQDIFVHDRATATTTRVSVNNLGKPANRDCFAPAISADGRHVAFASKATNLVAGDTNRSNDIFVFDRQLGTIERVSVDSAGNEASEDCEGPSISGDGALVVFWSAAPNLVSGDTGNHDDVFLRDRVAGVTTRLTVDASGTQANDNSFDGVIAANGSAVVFTSNADNLVPGDTNATDDVFLRDLVHGTIERASVVDSASGAEANGPSDAPSISAWGDRVAFRSDATNLVASDTNGLRDIFVHDRFLDTTWLASLDHLDAQTTDQCEMPRISGDGRTVAFVTFGDLDGSDANGRKDVYVRWPGCDLATWTNYGVGAPGATGVPAMVALSAPVLGAALSVQIDNSAGFDTAGFLLIGFARAAIPFKGATLLVDLELVASLWITAPSLVLTDTLPGDPALVGIAVMLQAIELDPSGNRGLSFTPGLELVLGN